MKKYLQIFLFSLFIFCRSDFVFAQTRLVIGGAGGPAYVNISSSSGATYLVIKEPTSVGIVKNNAAAGIISEGEFNYVKWMIGNTTGTSYLIPWRDNTTPGTEDVSVTFDIGTAGSAGGFFLASTYDGGTDNLSYKPTPVGNMTSGATVNASQWVVDRFWSLIDEASYGTKPALNNLKFAYVANEWNLNTGPITEINLRAQRWNTGGAGWEGLLFGAAPSGGTQTTAALTAANLFRWWTLVDNSKPLPVEWLDLSADCNHGDITIKWSTASEQNSDYFTVEKSFDGTNFTSIATVAAAGNSSTVKNYSAVDADPYSDVSFYRVKETDFNGAFIYSATVTSTGCTGNDITIYGTGDDISIGINAIEDGQYNIEMYDLLGQKLMSETKNVAAGNSTFKLNTGNFASAIYIVKIFNSNNSVTKKIFIRSTIQ